MQDSSYPPSQGSSTLLNSLLSLGLKTAYFGIGLIFIGIGLLYVKQDSLLYFPEIGGVQRLNASNPRRYRSPDEYSIPFETHMIKCKDGVNIHSWLLLHHNSKSDGLPTIIFFHGNAGNIGLRLPNANQLFHNLQANILMVEYRGYGESDSAKINEAGLKLDAEAAFDFIQSHPQINNDRIFLFGRSLGGAVAFHLVHSIQMNKKKLAGVMVENTFLSISKMVDSVMPFLSPVKRFVLAINWDSERLVPMIKCPVLYLAGDRDEIVPHYHMKELFELSGKASKYSTIHIVRGGTHNESWLQGGRKYYEAMSDFMSRVMQDDNSCYDTSISSQTNTTFCSSSEQSRPKESTGVSEIESAANALPLTPTNLVMMVKEAAKISSSRNNDTKKQN